MPIEYLRFTDAGPFVDIGFEFDERVNVFTGANNTGKSTALWVLGELLVYPFSIPSKMIRSDNAHWELGFRVSNSSETMTGRLPANSQEMANAYERIGFTCFVPAQRQGTNFRSPGPTVTDDHEARAEEESELLAQSLPEIFWGQDRSTLVQWYRSSRHLDHPELAKRRALMLAGATLTTDKAIKQKIVDLDYEGFRSNRPEVRAVANHIASVVSEITEGFPVSFSEVSKDEIGLFPAIQTPDGELPLDSLSQGTQSLFHFLSRFLLGYAEYYDFPNDLSDQPAILIIDEIDAHLHPSWQRRIISTLTNRFENLQIFCSTHSPLMLAGLETGQIQLLSRDEKGHVAVSTNETDIIGWTADEILRNVFDVRYPTDIETVGSVNRLNELESLEKLSDEQAVELESLRATVALDIHRGPGSVIVERFAEELRRARHGSNPSRSPQER